PTSCDSSPPPSPLFCRRPRPPISTLSPYTTLFRSTVQRARRTHPVRPADRGNRHPLVRLPGAAAGRLGHVRGRPEVRAAAARPLRRGRGRADGVPGPGRRAQPGPRRTGAGAPRRPAVAADHAHHLPPGVVRLATADRARAAHQAVPEAAGPARAASARTHGKRRARTLKTARTLGECVFWWSTTTTASSTTWCSTWRSSARSARFGATTS